MISLLWLHVQLLAVRRRIAVEQRGALSTEAVVITAALAALAIVVVAIITNKMIFWQYPLSNRICQCVPWSTRD